MLETPTIRPDPARGPIEVELGSSVIVKCISNVPYAIFTWHLLHNPPNLPEGIDTYKTGFNTSVFSISAMEESMYAQYVCEVSTPLEEQPLATVFTITRPGIAMNHG